MLRKNIVSAFVGLVAFTVVSGEVQEWRPKARWCGFNLLGMFCQTKMADGDKRIFGYFPEDRFQWMQEWGFNFARLPLDYRFFVEKDDWMKPCPPWPPVGWTNGVEWLKRNVVSKWQKAIDDGTFIHASELGCHQGNVPHATYLAWLEDTLKMCDRILRSHR